MFTGGTIWILTHGHIALTFVLRVRSSSLSLKSSEVRRSALAALAHLAPPPADSSAAGGSVERVGSI